MAFTILLIFLVNLVDIQGRTELGAEFGFRPDNLTHFDAYASALSKAHYNPWACSYRHEPGYKCLSCHKALHCYPSNFALLVQCAGIFPYCRNGYCSRFKTDGCVQDTDAHSVSQYSTMPPYVQGQKDNKTTPVTSQDSTLIDMDGVPDESSSNTVVTALNDPEILSEEQSTVAAEASVTPNIEEKSRAWID